MIYIKHLPKHLLLYNLWENAKITRFMLSCKDMLETPTIEQIKIDLQFMYLNDKKIYISCYYGKYLFSDLSGDYLDETIYDLYSGNGTAKSIVDRLKLDEIKRSLLYFYKSQ